MDYLVGYTGFVGSNLALSHMFGGYFNSKNIAEAYGKEPDLLVYAGVPAEMFLANEDPGKDRGIVEGAILNMEKINPKRIVLISTVAVYPDPKGATEATEISEGALLPYGANRRYLERFVQQYRKGNLIVRLPALYGKNLKKNFIYDYIHFIPSMLKEEKFMELSQKERCLGKFYRDSGNGFYHCRDFAGEERAELTKCFERLGFSAMNFTDSRSEYQFYNLKSLWAHIMTALNHGIGLLNLVTEPISVQGLYSFLEGKGFVNELEKPPFSYDIRTEYANLFHGRDNYLLGKDEVMQDIKRYVEEEKRILQNGE